jgi:SAM-dependent methyltransferase
MIEIFHHGMDNLSATQDAYDTIYETQGINHSDSFYLWILNLLKADHKKPILDISCGQGRLVNLARLRGYRALGIDFSMGGLQIALRESDAPIYCTADGEKLPFPDNSLDFITHIGSLEHYLHPLNGVEEIGRILKPGGRAVILLPNAFGLLGNIKYVTSHGEVFDDGQPIQRYATRHTWEDMLKQKNLIIEKVVPYHEIDFPQVWQDFIFLLARPQKIIRRIIALFIPVNLSNHFVFICTKK